jgi:hypothetical protein
MIRLLVSPFEREKMNVKRAIVTASDYTLSRPERQCFLRDFTLLKRMKKILTPNRRPANLRAILTALIK